MSTSLVVGIWLAFDLVSSGLQLLAWFAAYISLDLTDHAPVFLILGQCTISLRLLRRILKILPVLVIHSHIGTYPLLRQVQIAINLGPLAPADFHRIERVQRQSHTQLLIFNIIQLLCFFIKAVFRTNLFFHLFQHF